MDNPSHRKALYLQKKLLKQASESIPLSSLSVFVSALLISITFWNIADKIETIFWMFFLTATLILRNINARNFTQETTELSIETLEHHFKLLTLLTGSILSAGFNFIFPHLDPLYQSFILMVIAGLSAGAVMSLSVYKKLTIIYLVILILPVTYNLYTQETTFHISLSLLVLLFLLMLSIFSTKYHKNIIALMEGEYSLVETKKELKNSKSQFYTIFKQAPVGIFTYNTKLITEEANQTFCDILKSPIQNILGLDMHLLPDKSLFASLTAILQNKNGFYEGPYTTMLSQEKLWLHVNTVPLYNAEGDITGGLAIVTDITERIKTQKQLYKNAYYDTLTNLPNRLTLQDRLTQQLIRLKRHKHFGSVLFMDIDNFKNINDSLGHQIGDTLLKAFTTRLSSIIRQEDTFARLGGDEFVILLSDLGDKEEDAVRFTEKITKKLHSLLLEPITVKENSLHITTSIGVKIIGQEKTPFDDILKHADIAMYKAKSQGKNGTCFYQDSMSEKVHKQLELDNALHLALQNNEFELYFQPIAQTNDEKITSCEALIRWNHPTQGVIFPDDFIPFAENTNLIVSIGDWVIQNACLNYKNLHPYIKTIAINISPKQFKEDDFINKLIETTSKCEVNPSALKLELTESVSIENLSQTIEKMQLAKSYGFTFSMDDFGTGYSSLSYIRNLPFDYLKIDRSFITNVLTNEDDATLVQTFISIAKQFHFKVIAEGVESAEHSQFLKELECDYIQGYYLSKPVNLETFKSLVHPTN